VTQPHIVDACPARVGAEPIGRLLLPDWLPVLHRGPGELQIGLGPTHGIVLTGVPQHTEKLLALLDGRHTIDQLQAGADQVGVPPDCAAKIVRMIDGAGLLVHLPDAGQLGSKAGWEDQLGPDVSTAACWHLGEVGDSRVRLVGTGVLALAVAVQLMAAGIGRLYLADPDTVRNGRAPTALMAQLTAQSASTIVQPVRHWSKPEHPPPDISVIAMDTAEPPRSICDGYVRAGHRHLFVRPLLGGAIVGPMVHPGRSPCMGCLDHVRRDADPGWPALLEQLGRRTMSITGVLRQWAGVTVTIQILAALAGQTPSTVGATIESIPADFATHVRRWPMHVDCGCAWHD
jgi:hypothetical protein